VARARNVQHWYQLQQRGVAHIERETFDSALMSGRSVLELMGFERHQARNLALRFRRHNLEQLAEAAPHFKDESKLIALAKIGRAQMEQFMADERQRKDGSAQRGEWLGDRDEGR
jgi:glutathione-regulated potassium-efflux system ancillary protein KefC